MAPWRKVGLIAGGGALPVKIAEHLARSGSPAYVARITPFADEALQAFEGGDFGIGEFGARFQALRAAGCDTVVFAGVVRRVDPASVRIDERGMALLPRVLMAMQQGDDALLTLFVKTVEEEGFRVIGAEEACADLLAPPGAIGRHAPQGQSLKDIAKAAALASALGRWDVGQGVVVADGLVLALEAQEGTDGMLARTAQLPTAIRGTPQHRRGVLLKRPKPQQERRIDLPTIGLTTVKAAAEAGLCGIAVEAGGALILQRDEAVSLADQLGMFLYGFEPD